MVRSGDRVRLGADRGWELDAEQRDLLQGIALLASLGLAGSGAGPLGAVTGSRVVHVSAARVGSGPSTAATTSVSRPAARPSAPPEESGADDDRPPGHDPGSKDLGSEVA